MVSERQNQLTPARRTVLNTVATAGFVVAFGGETVSAQSGEQPIKDWNDLNAMRENPDGKYVLVENLDEDTAGYDEYVATPESGFKPIGNRETRFTGTLDGQGNEIRDLVINRPNERYVGLFVETAGSAVVTDIAMVNAEITGTNYVGSLVAINGGVITSASASGSVSGEEDVGSLAGYNKGEISRSTASGDVSGNEHVGGFVGFNINEISDSAASGDVSGNEMVGGLLGDNHGTVQRTFATGEVSGENRVGGLLGSNSGEVTASYWDTSVSGQNEGIGGDDTDGEVTGLTTAAMQGDTAKENMPGLDFDETWQVVTSPDNYPTLRPQPSERDGSSSEQETDRDNNPSEQETSDNPSSDSTPGFEITASLAAVASTSYLLKHRLTEDSE